MQCGWLPLPFSYSRPSWNQCLKPQGTVEASSADYFKGCKLSASQITPRVVIYHGARPYVCHRWFHLNPQQSYELGCGILLILHTEKLRHREVNQLPQVHTTNKRWKQDPDIDNDRVHIDYYTLPLLWIEDRQKILLLHTHLFVWGPHHSVLGGELGSTPSTRKILDGTSRSGTSFTRSGTY